MKHIINPDKQNRISFWVRIIMPKTCLNWLLQKTSIKFISLKLSKRFVFRLILHIAIIFRYSLTHLAKAVLWISFHCMFLQKSSLVSVFLHCKPQFESAVSTETLSGILFRYVLHLVFLQMWVAPDIPSSVLPPTHWETSGHKCFTVAQSTHLISSSPWSHWEMSPTQSTKSQRQDKRTNRSIDWLLSPSIQLLKATGEVVIN